MSRIVVLDGRTLNPGDNPWNALDELGQLTVHPKTAPSEIVERAKDAEVLVINKVRLDAETLGQLPKLKLIAVTATGFDCVDVSSAKKNGIVVCNVPIYGTDSVAQHVFAMLLHVIHRIDVHDGAIRAGEWEAIGDFSFWKSPLVELAGKTMGIIGFGRIGKQVGKLASAFGMSVIVASRSEPSSAEYPIESVSIEQLAARADVISLNCPLTEETERLINTDFLGRLKPNCIVLNAGRGALVDESALANALQERQLAAAAVDVCSTEPISPANPLLDAPNCFITPHLAWATLEARQRLMAVTVENVRAFKAGSPTNTVS